MEMTSTHGQSQGYGQAAVVINKPIEECFRIFCEFGKMHEYLPRKTKSQVIQSTETEALVYKELKFLFKTISFTILYKIDPKTYRIAFQLAPDMSHDIKESKGFYQFHALDKGRTLFCYGMIRMDSGVKIPGFIRDHLTSRDLPNIVRSVKKRVESGGTWKK